MSMSTYVEGIKPPDEKWLQMKAIWDACKKAGVEPPDEVSDFFEDGEPDPAGVIVPLTSYPKSHECISEYSDDGERGFEVDLSKLPKDITVLRFYNSW